MSVTMQTPVNVGGVSWLLAWSSDVAGAMFYVWRDGVLVMQTQAGEAVFYVPSSESPVFEVFDDADATPTAQAGRVALFWWASIDTSEYIVSQRTGQTWTEVGRVTDGGAAGFTWRSAWLDDCTAYEWRVEPLGRNGNLGGAVVWQALIVRTPDAPAQSFSYDPETGDVTIT